MGLRGEVNQRALGGLSGSNLVSLKGGSCRKIRGSCSLFLCSNFMAQGGEKGVGRDLGLRHVKKKRQQAKSSTVKGQKLSSWPNRTVHCRPLLRCALHVNTTILTVMDRR